MNQRLTAKDLSYIAMGVALIAVCSWISIPLPVPITLQTFAICLITAVLGLRLGLWAVVVYILLGAAGLPVFSGFRSGFGCRAGRKKVWQKAAPSGSFYGNRYSFVLCFRYGMVCSGVYQDQRGHRGTDRFELVCFPLSAAGCSEDFAGRLADWEAAQPAETKRVIFC